MALLRGRRLNRLTLVMGVAALAIGGACGGDPEPPQAQPSPDVTTFESGTLGSLPLHPRSEPVGAPSTEDGSSTRSYLTVGADPRTVLSFYEAELPAQGWNAVGPVEDIGTESFIGRWTKDGELLTVSATRAQGVEGSSPASDEVKTQYSLSVEPT